MQQGTRGLVELVVVLAALLACKKQASNEASPPATSATAAVTAIASPAPARSEPSVAPSRTASAVVAPVLPPIARGKVAAAVIQASKQEEDAGEQLYKAGKVAGSSERYERAVRADPGNVHARYELGRALARLGNSDAAFSILSELRDFGCPLCVERVMAAQSDAGFAALTSEPRYLDLAKGLEAKLFKLRPAAQRIKNWLTHSELGNFPAEELIDPRALVVIVDHTPSAPRKFRQVFGDDALRLALREQYPRGVVPGDLDRCAGGCCTAKKADLPAVQVLQICFTTYAESVVHLYKLELEGNPEFSPPG